MMLTVEYFARGSLAKKVVSVVEELDIAEKYFAADCLFQIAELIVSRFEPFHFVLIYDSEPRQLARSHFIHFPQQLFS